MSWAEQIKVISGVDDIEAAYAADMWDANRLGIRARRGRKAIPDPRGTPDPRGRRGMADRPPRSRRTRSPRSRDWRG